MRAAYLMCFFCIAQQDAGEHAAALLAFCRTLALVPWP
jgi:hypothetical protein